MYLPLRYTDGQGILKPMQKGRLCVAVEGGDLVGLGHACSYNLDGYLLNETDTYYGEALAIVRPHLVKELRISVTDGEYETTAKLSVATNV